MRKSFKNLTLALLLVASTQTFAAAVADPEAYGTKGRSRSFDARDLEYLQAAGGGTGREKDTGLDEGWRYLDPSMIVHIADQYFSFQPIHGTMETLVMDASSTWKSMQEKAPDDKIGFGNLATAYISFIIKQGDAIFPVAIPVTNDKGETILFESGFISTFAKEAAARGIALRSSTGSPLAVMALTDVVPMTSALFTSLEKLYQQACEHSSPLPGKRALKKTGQEANKENTEWKEIEEFYDDAKASSKHEETDDDGFEFDRSEEACCAATTGVGRLRMEGPLQFLHSEQLIRIFLQDPDNLAPMFEQLKGLIPEPFEVVGGILHICSRADMCPRCSITSSAATHKDISEGLFSQIFDMMREEDFKVSEDASSMLLVNSNERYVRGTTDSRADVGERPVLTHSTPERPVRAFHTFAMLPKPSDDEAKAAKGGAGDASEGTAPSSGYSATPVYPLTRSHHGSSGTAEAASSEGASGCAATATHMATPPAMLRNGAIPLTGDKASGEASVHSAARSLTAALDAMATVEAKRTAARIDKDGKVIESD